MVAGFDAPQRRAAGESSVGHHRRRQAAPEPGIVNVEAKLAKGPADRQRRTVGSRHDVYFVFLYPTLM
jgi:hypothetical protein